MALSIAEEQIKIKDWEYQRSFHDIQQILNSFFDIESDKKVNDTNVIVENEKQYLHSSDDLLREFYGYGENEVEEISERIWKAEKSEELLKNIFY